MPRHPNCPGVELGAVHQLSVDVVYDKQIRRQASLLHQIRWSPDLGEFFSAQNICSLLSTFFPHGGLGGISRNLQAFPRRAIVLTVLGTSLCFDSPKVPKMF